MKKLVVLFLLVIYGSATIGATLHLHYCMGTLVNVTFKANKKQKCGKCGMKENKKKKGCCQDEEKEFKLKTDHQKATAHYFIKYMATPALHVPTEYYIFKPAYKASYSFKKYYPPPILNIQNRQVLYCSFLI